MKKEHKSIGQFLVIVALGVIGFTYMHGEFNTPLRGPYPETLPAGYCLITNGSSYGTRYPFVRRWDGTIGYREMKGDHSEEAAIEWAWYMREYDMRRRAEPVAKSNPYRLANPELCKEPQP